MAIKSSKKKRARASKKTTATRKKSTRKKTTAKSSKVKKGWFRWKPVVAVLLVIAVAYTVYLDVVIRVQFEGKKWALPAQVYARPLELYSGLELSRNGFQQELDMLGYRYQYNASEPGSYNIKGNDYNFVTHAFNFWDGFSESQNVRVSFDNNLITRISDNKTGNELSLFRLEPPVIGRIYPSHKEDRDLIKLEQVPVSLIKGLIAVEDRQFYSHYGVNPKAIARAIWANLRAGHAVQGGSTLTQQLVKNFFLSNRRTLWRKANEAVMSLLLEFHYSKQDILEAYLNEIYLGQDGSRAIHGFGLASRFYFDKPIEQLNLPQIATLLALVRGPSYYDPRRHPKRLIKRRNLVLELMAEHEIIPKAASLQAKQAKQAALAVVPSPTTRLSTYPAFMDLVRRQLHKEYRASDLNSEGLQIFTTFNPHIQMKVEQSLSRRIIQLDKSRKLKGRLQGAMLVTDVVSGEVLAVVGDRNSRYAGFNRALDAARPIGSLIKPAVYLTALEQPGKYNLLTMLNDSPITLKSGDGDKWSPKNYDNVSHGKVPMYQALVHSYNQSTVRLGMELGFEKIADTLHRLGVERDVPPYPSMLLGSIGLTPFQVTQMYQTIASGGFYTPLKSVREVLTVDGNPLRRYPVNVNQAVKPEYIQVLQSAMIDVIKTGTAHSAMKQLPGEINFAGKTGTTDDLKDSWFAGFSGDYLAVSWMGADDNSPIRLSGSSGALRTWTDVMSEIARHSINMEATDEVVYHWIDRNNNKLTSSDCERAVQLAFIKGTEPKEESDCSSSPSSDTLDDGLNWFQRLFR